MLRQELLNEYHKSLIREIAIEMEKVGPKLSNYLADHFKELSKFLKCTKKGLTEVENNKGKPCIKNDLAAEIEKKAKHHSGLIGKDIRIAWIIFLAKKFFDDMLKSVSDLELDKFDINPLLVKALNLKTPKEIIRFSVYQFVNRSPVTSWGTTVEKMLKYSGCELVDKIPGVTGRRPDLKKVRVNKEYLFQIKSGPNSMNIDMVKSLNKEISEANKSKGKMMFLGITYGTKDSISPQIKKYLDDFENSTKIGRELWDFISESQDYHEKVISELDEAFKNMTRDFNKCVEEKINYLVNKWNLKYRKEDINSILKAYI